MSVESPFPIHVHIEKVWKLQRPTNIPLNSSSTSPPAYPTLFLGSCKGEEAAVTTEQELFKLFRRSHCHDGLSDTPRDRFSCLLCWLKECTGSINRRHHS